MSHIAQPDDILADRFRIVRWIADGGMGEVYEAEDRILDERVALKLLNHRSVNDERAVRRFQREIQLSRRVTHPNVCRLFDVFQHVPDSGRPNDRPLTFVTMELLDGETLSEYLRLRGPLNPDEALPLARQMAEALSAAHGAGIVHRDFKASNVMLARQGGAGETRRVVVTDFGLARAITRAETEQASLTGEFRVVGTPAYMAPEQIRGRDATPTSDVYSFGVVLFEMVTGRRPFTAANPLALLAKRNSEGTPEAREFRPDLDPVWNEVIAHCLEDDPESRFRTPEEVIAALDAPNLKSESITTSHQQTTELHRPAAHRPRNLALAAGLVLTAVLGWWASRVLAPPPDPPAPEPPHSAPYGDFVPVQWTTDPGLELDPAFSPDGRVLVYSIAVETHFELHARHLDQNGAAIRLTTEGQAFEPAWTPDDEIIYHDAERGGLWLLAAPRTASGEFEAEPPRTRRLTTFGSQPAVSPDGRRLVFQSASAPLLSSSAIPALSTLWSLDLDAGDAALPRRLTETGRPAGAHGSPALSPDGRHVAFVANSRGEARIWIVPAAGGEPMPLVSEPRQAFDPVFAADGRELFFAGATRQVSGLWRIALDPRTGAALGAPEELVNLGVAAIRRPTLSIEGKLAYTALVTTSHLWALPLDPTTARPNGSPRPLTRGGGRHSRPAFSPDGDRIAFDRRRLGTRADLWIGTSEGEDLRRITNDPSDNSLPSWMPDGDELAFVTEHAGRRSLFAVDIATKRRRPLVELPDDSGWAVLSPDGAHVAYHARGEGGSLRLRLHDLNDGGDRRLVPGDDSWMAFPRFSGDGEWLAFQAERDDGRQVMAVPTAGGEPVQLTREAGQSWPYSFAPDHDKIAFAAQREGRWSLRWVSRASGREETLIEPEPLHVYVRYPSWSPRGDRLIYERAETGGDIWIVGGE